MVIHELPSEGSSYRKCALLVPTLPSWPENTHWTHFAFLNLCLLCDPGCGVSDDCLKSMCALLLLGGDRVKILETWLVPSAVDTLSWVDSCCFVVFLLREYQICNCNCIFVHFSS